MSPSYPVSRDLPVSTSIAKKHALDTSSSGKSIQLCNFGRSVARCIPSEHMTRNAIVVECNHGFVWDANGLRKTIQPIDPIITPTLIHYQLVNCAKAFV